MHNTTINCNETLLSLEQPIIMGIINATPDSFYTQGRNSDLKGILHTAHNMMQEGATILDIGGLSTRPGSDSITVKEEIDRVVPAIEQIKKHFPKAIISIDTYRSEVAVAAADYGATIINDVSGGNMDKQMIKTVAKLNLPYIMMHMQGNPKVMQEAPHYDDIMVDISKYFVQKIDECRSEGIKDIILDPGFGFGKTIEHNYQLLRNLNDFNIFKLPILVGISRKSMIYKPLNTTPELSLNATTAAHTLALMNGAKILRVHDVAAAQDALNIYKLYNGHPIN